MLIPTYAGHLEQVSQLVASIRLHCSASTEIHLVISATDRPSFELLAASFDCHLMIFESLLEGYSGRQISTAKLLTSVGRFRFQALKKLLGIAALEGEVFVLDSESLVCRDLSPILEGGLIDTSVIYSERPWHSMSSTLTAAVYDECCFLLGQQPFWFFESFNWLYSSDLTRDLLATLKTEHGTEWIFRPRPLFECQLYYQYAFQKKPSTVS